MIMTEDNSEIIILSPSPIKPRQTKDLFHSSSDLRDRLIVELDESVLGKSANRAIDLIHDIDENIDGNIQSSIGNISDQINEEEASRRLILQLMQEEEAELYRMQYQYMSNQSAELSEEDMLAVQAALSEHIQPANAMEVFRQGSQEDAEEEDQNDEENSDESNIDNWDYDRLLELGQVLGDVKTEKWRTKAAQVVESLPTTTYGAILETRTPLKTPKDTATDIIDDTIKCNSVFFIANNDQKISPGMDKKRAKISKREDYRCSVCLENFECTDELKLLPCQHYFHVPCAQGWLADHNSCPSCKVKVVQTP